MTWGEVELEPEVRDWLEGLDDQRWAQAMFHLDLLEERRRAARRAVHPAVVQGGSCGETPVLLRRRAHPDQLRRAFGRRIIALTMLAKTRMRETAEIARGVRGDGPLPAGHLPDEEDR